MKKFKQFTAYIIVFAICLSLANFTCLQAYAEDNTDFAYQNKVHVLEKLGILTETADDEKVVTRGDAALLISNMGKRLYPVNESEVTYYYDVDNQTKNAKAINSLKEYGIMLGYDNNLFKPDQIIACDDFIITILRMGGFSEIADMRGGYPNGYSSFVQEIKSGVSASNNFTYRQCVEVIYNALSIEVPVASFSGAGQSDIKISSDYTLYEYLFEITKYRGTIVANGYISLNGRSRTANDQITVREQSGRETTFNTDEDTNEYIGSDIDYYVDKDEENVICIFPCRQIKKITVQNEDIIDVDTGITNVEYQNTAGKAKKISVIKDANFVYNGTSSYNVSADDITQKEGYTEFIDTDDDGKYDLVKIWNYKTYFVGNISQSAYSISDINTGSTAVLDSDDSNYNLYIKKLGTEITFDMIEKYNVVSIAESNEDTGEKLITAEVSDNVIEGSITGIAEDSVFIDGEEYQTAAGFNKGSISVGTKGKFGVNFRNKLVAVYTTTPDGIQYGFLMNVFSENGLEERGIVKLMNIDSQIVKLCTSNKFYINDEKATTDGLMQIFKNDTGADQQIISYKLDSDGNIKRIYYSSNANGGLPDSRSKYELICNRSFEGDVRFFLPSGVVDGVYYMKSEMPVFRIITDKDGNIIEDLSSVVRYGSCGTESGYRFKMKIYDANEKQEPAIGLLKFNSNEWANWYKAPYHAMAITHVGAVVDEYGDVVNAIEGYDNGREVRYYINEDVVPVTEFKKGDLCLIMTNGKYVLKSTPIFRLHCENYTDKMLFGDYSYTPDKPGHIGDNDNSYGKSSIMSCSIGRINNVFDNGILFTPDGTDESRRYEILNQIAVYEETPKGTYIVKQQTDLSPGSGRCLIYTRYGIVVDVIILED